MYYNDDNNQFHSDGQPPYKKSPVSPSDRLASFSMWCALFAVITFYVPAIALPLGSVAIILGLLSRGGHARPGRRARYGIRMGTAAIIISTGITAATIGYTIHQYGSLQNFYKQYQKQFEKIVDGNPSESEGGDV